MDKMLYLLFYQASGEDDREAAKKADKLSASSAQMDEPVTASLEESGETDGPTQESRSP